MRPPDDGTDPAYAPEREQFRAYTHQEIWELVHERLDPGALGEAAAAWQVNAAIFGEAIQAFSDSTNREFARWSGHASDVAREATREFVRAGTEVHDVCGAVRQLLELNADAAQSVRDAIPPPRQYLPLADPVAEAVHGGKRAMDHDIAAAGVTADVQDAMTYIYTPTMPASGDRVPRFPHPGSIGGSGA